MRIPKQIDVLGKKWKVSYRWRLLDGDIKCDGLCCHTSRTIFIDRSTAKADRPQIFLHELLHAVLFEAKLTDAESFSCEIEEILVEVVSSYLLDTFAIRLKSK